jgi:V/A-type H+-transporting ATPase subunit E
MSEERLHLLLETLKKQGLETGEAMGRQITDDARREAEEIVARAKAEAEAIVEKARRDAELEAKRLDSSLAVAASKFVNDLKHRIEDNLLKAPLKEEIEGVLGREEFARQLIVDFVKQFAAEHPEESLGVRVPKTMSAEVKKSIAETLTKLSQGKGGTLVIDDPGLKQGFAVEMKGGNLRLDFSEEAFLELFLSYFSPEFRHYFDGYSSAAGEAS